MHAKEYVEEVHNIRDAMLSFGLTLPVVEYYLLHG